MALHHGCGSCSDTVAVLASGNELPDGAASRFLHGDSFCLCSLAQGVLLAIRETQRHGHTPNGINPIPHRSAISRWKFT